MKNKVRVGLFGASGYTGLELVKAFGRHPHVELVYATSEQSVGRRMSEIFPHLGHDIELSHSEEVDDHSIDAAFLCLPHEKSAHIAPKLLEKGIRVIDLSADFRLNQAELYPEWYHFSHPRPDLLQKAVYGLSEFNRPAIAKAQLIANPGCYPSSVLLGVLPALRRSLIDGQAKIIIDAKSGISGAGRKPALGSLFTETNENITPYNIGTLHRHVPEIRQGMKQFGGQAVEFVFSPHLVPISQGMLSTIYTSIAPELSLESIHKAYVDTYAQETFVKVLPLGSTASVRHVSGTNFTALSLHASGSTLIIVSALDNLIKGASGQALQNFNIAFGLKEGEGLWT